MRGTWRKKHSDFENSFSHEFFLLKFVRAQPAGALFCIQPAAVLPLWGCCPALPWLGSPPCALHCSWPGVSGDQPPSPSTPLNPQRLRPNNSGVITWVGGHPTANTGAAGHMLPPRPTAPLLGIVWHNLSRSLNHLLVLVAGRSQ